MRNPFAARRRASTASTGGRSGRAVPAPEVMAGVEFLDTPTRETSRAPAPEVAVCGLDPQVPGSPSVARLHLVVAGEGPRPDSVDGLLARGDDAGVRVRRLTVDVRGFRDVLESRGGWNLLGALVRDPSDRVTNAVFRAAVAGGEGSGPVDTVLEDGDVDCEVSIVGEGDTVAGRCRHELGRGRLSLTGFLADSERLTRRLAEALARPRDRATRRCFEHALADVLADAPLTSLLGRPREAPYCTVPGTWATASTPTTPVPRAAGLEERVPTALT